MKYRNPETGEVWDSETGQIIAPEAVPDYRQAFAPNPLMAFGHAGALQIEKLVRGGQKLLAGDDPARLGQLAAEQADADKMLGDLQATSPKAAFAGSMAPGIASAALPGGLLAQMGYGAGMAGLEYGENQGTQAAIGGALSGAGYGVGQLLSKGANVVRAVAKRPETAQATGLSGQMVKKANKLGMKLQPGDVADSRQLKQIDVGIKRNPATADLVEDSLEENQRILNRTAIQAMGETGNEVSENLLAKAANRIGGQYDSILSDVDEIVLDTAKIQSVVDEMAQDSLPYVERYLKRFPSLQRGVITGKEAGRLRNLIQKDARLVGKNFKADPDDLNNFQSMILEAAEESSGNSKDILKRAGQEWRIMKALERGQTVTKGNVNPKPLETGLRQFDKRFKRGLLAGQELPEDLQRLYDATKVANHFSDVVGDSGTPTALQASEFLDPKSFLQRQLLRRGARQYLESGNVPATLGILDGLQQPATPIPGQIGAGMMRGILGANQ